MIIYLGVWLQAKLRAPISKIKSVQNVQKPAKRPGSFFNVVSLPGVRTDLLQCSHITSMQTDSIDASAAPCQSVLPPETEGVSVLCCLGEEGAVRKW